MERPLLLKGLSFTTPNLGLTINPPGARAHENKTERYPTRQTTAAIGHRHFECNHF